MRKRALLFLLALGLLVSISILGPITDRLGQENSSINTSLSYAPFGYKGLYMLLGQLEPKTGLWQHSIMNMDTEKPKTVWFVEPGEGLFFSGPQFKAHMTELVEHGANLIFVLDSNHLDEEKDLPEVLQSLNQWFNLKLDVDTHKEEDLNLAVLNHFGTRELQTLAYKKPDIKAARKKLGGFRLWFYKNPRLSLFTEDAVKGGDVLLETMQHEPLIVRFKRGKGSITVFPNSFYLSNGQLNRGDNAALAVALQEVNRSPATYFEVYSNGFNENRDFFSYLATGKGVAFLISLLLLLGAFCFWMIQSPIRRKQYLATSEEKFFTQEVFISALARHYIETKDWDGLYLKLTDQFRKDLDKKYPGLKLDDQIDRIAGNAFFNVDTETLKAVFNRQPISTEKEFITRSQHLLEVQRKVSRYEQHESRGTRTGSATSVSA